MTGSLPAEASSAGVETAGEAFAAVLFDMDGLLVDTEPLWSIAENELAASFGAVFTQDIKAAMVGHGIDTALPLMLSMLGVPDADPREASMFLLRRVTELFSEPERITPMPGALELLAGLAEMGVPTALVSSSFRALMDPVLDVIDRHHRFDVTVAGDEVTLRKPAPEPYLRAAEMLGVDPTGCVVLEDSASGAASGLAAGCRVIMVPSERGVVAMPGTTAAASLTELTLDLLAMLP